MMKLIHLFLIVLIVSLTVNKSDAKPTKRIFNGSVATLAPHVCLVFAQHAGETNGFLGTGSIIGVRHVLTAAQLLVRAGSVQILFGNVEWQSGDSRTTQSFILHPQYNPTTNANDIGIVVIPFSGIPFTWSDTVQPIRLPPLIGSQFPTVGAVGTVMGIGFTSEAVPAPSPNVMQATLTVVAMDQCAAAYEFDLSTTHFCAISQNVPPSSVCPGDNGAGFFTGELSLPEPSEETEEEPEQTEEEPGQTEEEPEPTEEELTEEEPEPTVEELTEEEPEELTAYKFRVNAVANQQIRKRRNIDKAIQPRTDAVLVGIASLFRFACSAHPQPTAFTSVSHFRIWIADMTGIGD